MKKRNVKLILASGSPRRRRMLKDAGYKFTAVTSDAPERMPKRGNARAIAMHNALAKARSVAKTLASGIVIGSDTVVAKGTRILGKPADEADARRMLKELSMTRHCVVSAVALVDASSGREATVFDETYVTMRKMTDAEIRAYVESGEAMGKAGAYAIQETGDKFVEKIEGRMSAVVGFPIELFKPFLAEFVAGAE